MKIMALLVSPGARAWLIGRARGKAYNGGGAAMAGTKAEHGLLGPNGAELLGRPE